MEVKVPEYRLDIVVPTHDHVRLTMGCMDCLYSYTESPFHLIIVDDSTDLTPQYIRELKKARANITYIHSKEPYKCGNQIFNIALEHCKTPYLATVMNSIEVEPGWEIVPLKIMEHEPDVGSIGMKCLFSKSGLIECAGIYMNMFLPCDVGRDEPSHRLSEVYQCEATQWAFALHRVEAVKGVLSEDVYHGFVGVDDIDNCFTLRNNGWRILNCGLSVAYHHPRATRGRNDKIGYDLNRENLESFYKRWGYWDEFHKANPEIPETLNGVKPIANGRGMLEKEMEKNKTRYVRSAIAES